MLHSVMSIDLKWINGDVRYASMGQKTMTQKRQKTFKGQQTAFNRNFHKWESTDCLKVGLLQTCFSDSLNNQPNFPHKRVSKAPCHPSTKSATDLLSVQCQANNLPDKCIE